MHCNWRIICQEKNSNLNAKTQSLRKERKETLCTQQKNLANFAFKIFKYNFNIKP